VLNTEKRELRARQRQRRLQLPEADWSAASARIVDNLLRLDCMQAAGGVALFWPMLERREVDLRDADARLRARGVRIAYPFMNDDLGFRWTPSTSQLLPNLRGFFEPSPDCARVEPQQLDVVVVPALAASLTGYRLGYGAGFYDRVLGGIQTAVVSVVVVFEAEVESSVPVEPHDRRVDWVVTEARATPI
jgi:5-formyltetrahydrofolate cyclo-ligase